MPYPEVPTTLGDHLRKRRHELRLTPPEKKNEKMQNQSSAKPIPPKRSLSDTPFGVAQTVSRFGGQR